MAHRIRSRLTAAAVFALTLAIAAACTTGPGSPDMSTQYSSTFPVVAGGY